MRKIIDSHLHISKWGEDDIISCFDNYKREKNVSTLNICAIPLRMSNVANNILVALYKLAHPDTYIHGGIEIVNIPLDNMPADMNAVTQYKELMEIGFGGIKMLEGKPNVHKIVGKNLNHPSLNMLYKAMEEDGTHLLMHSNDPDEFWDTERAPDWAVNAGWTYTDGTFSSYEEIQGQTIKILEDHPNLSLTLAHFFFCGKTPELLEGLFSLYPNLCVDLTPGGEMYVEFEKNYSYYKDFFNKYSKRLIFGTDRAYLGDEKYGNWIFDLVTTFIDTDKPTKSFDNKDLLGLDLSQDKRNDILFGNFTRRVGEKPRTINREALRKYIDKYSFALTEYDKEKLKPLIKKYL